MYIYTCVQSLITSRKRVFSTFFTDRARAGRPTDVVRSLVATEIVAVLQSHGMRVPVQGGRHDAQRHDGQSLDGTRRRSADRQAPDRQRVRVNGLKLLDNNTTWHCRFACTSAQVNTDKQKTVTFF